MLVIASCSFCGFAIGVATGSIIENRELSAEGLAFQAGVCSLNAVTRIKKVFFILSKFLLEELLSCSFIIFLFNFISKLFFVLSTFQRPYEPGFAATRFGMSDPS